MASSSMARRFLPLLLLVVVCHYPAASAGRNDPPGASSCYMRLFILGDSISDAGNFSSVAPNSSVLAFPYGETFFRRPTGRFCDGRLIVDFIAEALELPFLTSFLDGKTAADFRQGANFAVSGATALSQQFFKDMGLVLTILPPFSLDNARTSCRARCSCPGEIGVNDYNHPFFQNRSVVDEIRPLVPKVIAKIENATKVLIGLGAKTIVVPGTVPMGCIPRYQTMFQSDNPGDYDAAGCIRWLNDFAEEHNRALRRMLGHLVRPRDDHHQGSVAVVYADYYGAILEITGDPLKHGFRKDVALTACCGDGGPHNSGALIACNDTSVLCSDPSGHISWDGLHLTEAAYQFVARGVLDGPYAAPPILSKCRC